VEVYLDATITWLGIEIPDPIQPYVQQYNTTTVRWASLKTRVQSKAYHDEEKRWTDREETLELAQEKIRAFAKTQLDRFVELVNVEWVGC
jgi:hypothetical protein